MQTATTLANFYHPPPPLHNLSSSSDPLHLLHNNSAPSNDSVWGQPPVNVTQSFLDTEVPSWPTYLPLYVTILNVVVFFTGTVGNVLVIVVVLLVREMRTPMNWYLVNLSLADLLVLLVCQPAALVEFFALDRWYLGAALCKLVPFLEHTVLHASTLIIVSITVERYYAICRPLKKLAVCHKPRPLRVLPCLWATAILTSLPFIVMTSLDHTTFYDGTPCKVCVTGVSERWHYVFIISMTLCFFLLPLLLLLCLYCRIIRALRSSGSALRIGQVRDVTVLSSHRSRKQVIKMLMGIVLLFFVSLLPVRCVVLWQVLAPPGQIKALGPETYYNVMWAGRLLMYTNSAGNPIIYSLISSNFKQAFWRLLTGARHAPSHLTARESESSRRGWSVSGVHRGLMSHHPGSSLRLVSLDSPSVNGHQHQQGSRVGSPRAGQPSTSVVTTCASSPSDSAASSPLVKKGVVLSMPFKSRSCTTIL
ncbi:growth hormone secretagogue receptor type 1-like isoform X2 [Babylonia areolata]|uniref:growth hormone secretagogue receptor type 1-like isoform X2 n=1 Tax=Babylonia areolata TaxID=304850 RepID=UPI003FD52B2A